MILSPSVLACDFGHLDEQVRRAVAAGAQWIHIDVMDGRFVPNITMGPVAVRALRAVADDTGALLDVHLMVHEPDRYVEDFVKAGADILTVHVEACTHLHRTVEHIKECDVKAGVTLNPATPLVSLEEILPEVDLALVMSVNPGFSWQTFIPSSVGKIRRLRGMLDAIGSEAYLEVDGGINPNNVADVLDVGVTVVVAGGAVFGGDGSIEENVAAFFAAANPSSERSAG